MVIIVRQGEQSQQPWVFRKGTESKRIVMESVIEQEMDVGTEEGWHWLSEEEKQGTLLGHRRPLKLEIC